MHTSPEIQLLLAYTHPTSGTLTPVTHQPSTVDWERVYQSACWHRLRPQLHRTLVTPPGDHAPAWLRERLQEDLRAITNRNLLRAAELISLLDALSSEDVPAIPIKGPTLALKLYGGINGREFGDLDILVRQEDHQRAEALMARHYLELPQPEHHQMENYERSYQHPESGTVIELHRRLHLLRESFRIDYDRLFRSPGRLKFFGRELRDLPVEDWLLLLSIHGARHRYFRLNWLLDLATLTLKNPVDWERVAEEADRAGARRCLRLTLLLIRELWSIPAPAPLQQALDADREVQRLASAVALRLRRGDCQDYSSVLDGCFWGMRLQDEWRSRATYGRWIGSRVASQLLGHGKPRPKR